MTTLPFHLSSGSIPGRHHHKALRNNQDAHAMMQHSSFTIAVVADGCGSSPMSEVGAQLFTRYLVNAGHELLRENALHPVFDLRDSTGQVIFLEALRQRALGVMHGILAALGSDRDVLIADYFLFTILGAVLTPTMTLVFGLGDGVYQLNDKVVCINQNNTPGYLGYAATNQPVAISSLAFEVREVLPTTEVQYLVLGTDGAEIFTHDMTAVLRDGSVQGGLNQFQDERYSKMKLAVEKRLRVIGHLNGRAEDDTTLIVIQRHKEATCLPS